MGVKKITVIHKRNDCIGCNSCVILDPKNRTIDNNDGKACLKGAIQKGSGQMISHIDADDIQSTRDAANACPVGVIKVAE